MRRAREVQEEKERSLPQREQNVVQDEIINIGRDGKTRRESGVSPLSFEGCKGVVGGIAGSRSRPKQE